MATVTRSCDLHVKFDVYRRNKVREYVAWRVVDREIDWFVLQQRKYVRLARDKAGFYRSKVFPGLWLDPAAPLAGDAQTVLAAPARGLASREHAAFVARLNPPQRLP
jgi:hypothetical protein